MLVCSGGYGMVRGLTSCCLLFHQCHVFSRGAEVEEEGLDGNEPNMCEDMNIRLPVGKVVQA